MFNLLLKVIPFTWAAEAEDQKEEGPGREGIWRCYHWKAWCVVKSKLAKK